MVRLFTNTSGGGEGGRVVQFIGTSCTAIDWQKPALVVDALVDVLEFFTNYITVCQLNIETVFVRASYKKISNTTYTLDQ
jgi:hypothetical protein